MRDQIIEHLKFAAELGVTGISTDPVWRTRQKRLSSAEEPRQAAGGDVEAAPLALVSPETLAAIKADIGDDCRRCKLHKLGRKQIVFGVGNPNADLMFVGEAPGA